MKIYTKTGDRGDTRLFDGTRTRKDDSRVDAYGDIDELNSFIGAAAAWISDREVVAMLQDIQRDLFSVGAELANPKSAEETSGRFHLDPRRIEKRWTDLKPNCLRFGNSYLREDVRPEPCCMSRVQYAGGGRGEWSRLPETLRSTKLLFDI